MQSDQHQVLAGVQISHQLSSHRMADRFAGTLQGENVVVLIPRSEYQPGQPAYEAFINCQHALDTLPVTAPVPRLRAVPESGSEPPLIVEYVGNHQELSSALLHGLSLEALLKYCKDIARTLAQLHREGLIHGNLSPEAIRVRPGHGVMLTDYSCMQPVDQAPAWQTSVLSPHERQFMAPELLAGATLSTSVDLYSLCSTLYTALIGSPPNAEQGQFSARSQDPKLPTHLNQFHALLEKGLARQPENRLASPQAFIEAIEDIRASENFTDTTLRTAEVSRQEIRFLGDGLLTTPMDTGHQERRSTKQRKRRQRRINTAVVVLALVAAGVFAYRTYSPQVDVEALLAGLGIAEDPELIVAWNNAQALREDPNQGLATIVAGYQRVLTMAPDHAAARASLAGLASDWKSSIDADLQNNNLQAAATRLDEAGAVFPDDVEWVRLRTRLQNRQRADRIFDNTRRLLASYGLSDLPAATAAIQSFQEVLRLAPAHPDATRSLTELSEHYAGLATQALQSGQLNEGISLLERATAADKTVPQLDDVRKLISQRTSTQAAIEELLSQARRLRAEDKLMLPAGENAAELYHRVLATDPRNSIAIQGLNEITSQVAQAANGLLAEGDVDAVEQLVSTAQGAALPAEGVAEIRRRMEAERSRQTTISENLLQAEALMLAGYLTEPAEANAVLLLREVQQVDPGNTSAGELLQQCAERLAAVAVEAREFELLDEAKQYLDLALAITPEVDRWVALRESWQTEQNIE